MYETVLPVPYTFFNGMDGTYINDNFLGGSLDPADFSETSGNAWLDEIETNGACA